MERIPTSLFDYDLPPDRIAQRPAEPRDASRLLVLDRATGAMEHAVFGDLPRWLRPGDALVLNNTRVLPARFYGTKRGGGARIEVLLLEDRGGDRWRALCNRARRLRPGSVIDFGPGESAAVEADLGDGRFDLAFSLPGSWTGFLERRGEMPLPPYIAPHLDGRDDRARYQTVYARTNGSAAAPTAGLHFTPRLLQQCREKGVEPHEVTLHVGLDTFRPVTAGDLREHPIHTESYQVDAPTAAALNAVRDRGGRVIAVGTTSARTLETITRETGRYAEAAGRTDLYILPGHVFRGVDGLVTNFHLPKSTLLALVGAFCGWDLLKIAYETAIREGYRFYSYGDAMLIT